MKVFTFFVMIIWIFTAAEMVKGEEKGKMDQAITLPSEVEGWKWDGKEIKYNSKTLFDYIDGAAGTLSGVRFSESDGSPV